MSKPLGKISQIASGKHAGSYLAVCFKCRRSPRRTPYNSAGVAACGLKKHLQNSHSVAVGLTRSAQIVGWNQKAENRKTRALKGYRERLADTVKFFLGDYRLEQFADALRPVLRKHLHRYDFGKLEEFRRVWRGI